MTITHFNNLHVGDLVSGYTITKIDKINGIFNAKRQVNHFCEYLQCHYKLFLIYNKKLHKYE